MLCVASLLVLGILSIFSAKYRDLAREALDCVLRRITLRPCTTGFDTKVKATILSKLINRSPRWAKFFNQRYELISWIFVGLFFASIIWTGRGIYNYWAYGNCSGLNQGGFCAFDPTGKNNEISGNSIECRSGGKPTGDLTISNIDLDMFFSVPGSDKELVFIGCYSCPFTKKTYPLIKKIVDTYKPSVSWIFYPTHSGSEHLLPYDYCIEQQAPEQYPTWIDTVYTSPNEKFSDATKALQLIKSINIDSAKITQCVNDPATKTAVQKRIFEIDKTGIYGTPTVFLNGTPVVGPKPDRVYRRLLNNSLL